MHITLASPIARDRAVIPYDIKQLKKALNRLGLYVPLDKTGITGIADAAMFDALKHFQTTRGLKGTGTIKPDDETITALNSEISVTPTGSYVWRSVEDAKVRGAHAAFNRTIRSWADSPDPGEDYNCRCWAESLPPDEPGLGNTRYMDTPIVALGAIIAGPVIRGAVSALGGKISREAIKSAVRKIIRPQVGMSRSKLQHANQLGIEGSANNQTLDKFKNAIQKHVNSREMKVIKGTYRNKEVTHYYDSKTNLNVMIDSKGNLEGVWKLNEKQVEHVLSTGKLGGGR